MEICYFLFYFKPPTKKQSMLEIKTSILITEEQIQKKIQELAQALNKKFKGKKLVAIGVLNGSFAFYSDLIRSLSCQVLCDFCATSSYGKKKEASQEVKLTMDTYLNIAGKHMLLIEDIVDRGRTLNFLKSHFKNRDPLSLTTVALIVKPQNIQKQNCQVDYTGFKVEQSSFLVGYGLDYQEQFRYLPYIAEINSLN